MSSQGQTHFYEVFSKKEKLADQYFQEKQYKKAASLYQELWQKENHNKRYLNRLAESLFHMNQWQDAYTYYQIMENRNWLDAQQIKDNYYTTLMSLGRHKKALKLVYKADSIFTNNFYRDSAAVVVQTTGINSQHNDFGPATHPQGILFLSSRPIYSPVNFSNSAGNYLSSIYLAQLAEDGQLLPPDLYKLPIITPSTSSVGGVSCFENETKIIVSAHLINAENTGSVYSLYYFEKVNTDQWQLIKKLNLGPGNFLQPHYHEKSGILYFAWDQGVGENLDLYYCKLDHPEKIKPLGKNINTPGSESYPFIYQDSILFFSSNGHIGMGGTDIYKINLKNPDEMVENVGAPLNSEFDDFGLILYPFSRFGFFSSNRNKAQNDNIYKFLQE
ncbi:MAG: tetratricopeptide repeat protein [Candidatus Cyclobacteriaceae bacterium M3_2C_046]